jgi:hypothetical protein
MRVGFVVPVRVWRLAGKELAGADLGGQGGHGLLRGA